MITDIIGNTYSRLEVIGYSAQNKKYITKCTCGKVHLVNKYNLVNGLVKSCGCLRLEGNNKQHGERYTRLYGVWKGMRCRCYTKSSISYKNYGARGIVICKEWDNFLTFKEWALNNGYKDGLTIDRIDVNGNYTPNNCRWVGIKENNNNRRSNRYITYKGSIKTMSQWANEYNIKPATLWARLNRGWDIEKALKTN